MIYDCFTFFNELDILEIRLNILNDVVDRFVLVEATRTHQGKLKTLLFNENKERYKKFKDKIIHIVIDEYPPYEGRSAWILERYQREMIAKGWTNCQEDDIILVSDVDEIPAPDKISKFKNSKGVFIFRQRMYCYYLNCENVNRAGNYRWDGTVMSRYGYKLSPMQLRELSIIRGGSFSSRIPRRLYNILKLIRWQISHRIKIKSVQDGGWHFTYLGGTDMIIRKLEAFAHTEFNKKQYKNPDKIEEIINTGKDIFNREFKYEFVPLDNSFPAYIVNNKEKYKRLIKGNNEQPE